MRERANYLWRLAGTGFSFFLFGAVGLVFWGLLFPLLVPFMGQGVEKKRKTRAWMSGMFRWYMGFMRDIGILEYEVHGGGRLGAEGRLVIANHPCLLDIVFLISQIPNATCIVKPALASNPFMRIPIRAMGYIYAEDPEDLVERCAQELREGGALIVFPEGTRSTPGQPLKFQRGAAAIALGSGAKILPVTLDCFPITLTKQEKWYQIPHKKFRLSLHAGDEMALSPADLNLSRSHATRSITRQWEQYFQARQAGHG